MAAPEYEKLFTLCSVPERTSKPRNTGITIMLDKGLGCQAIADLGEITGAYADYAKVAWATALATKNLEEKVNTYREHGITVMLGGTLFEYLYLRGKTKELLDFVRATKLHLEISDGVIDLPRKEKLRYLEMFAAHTEVFSELGKKIGVEEHDWGTMIREDLAAGAKKLVIEGREIGPVGQKIRTELVDELVAATNVDNLIFEALERYQQIYLINRFGPNVNLGNILPADLMMVEAFRLGLKEQTLIDRYRAEETRDVLSARPVK